MEKRDRQSGKRGRDQIFFLTAAMFVLFICGCEESKPSKDTSDVELISTGTTENKSPSIDPSDPEAVARAFIIAMVNNNAQEAAQYVIPEEREQLEEAMEKGMPPLPNDPEIKVKVKSDGIQADVFVLNAKPPSSGGPPFGLDMRLSNGSWWIVK